jgi:hypothetical protein
MVWPFIYRNCKEKKDDLVRIFRTEEATKNLFKTVYYICINSLGYYILS